MKVVIFCGGHGTRFWPLRRDSFSKPFIPFINGESLVKITYKRYRKMFSPLDILISTEKKYVEYAKSELPEVPDKNIILEPERRDTMPAYGLVAAFMDKYYPDECALFSWAKHIIRKEEIFLNAVKAAGEYVKETGINVSIDSKPETPSMYNGWIKKGDSTGELGGSPMFELVQQIGKPKLDVAKKMFLSDSYLIHTGNTIWNIKKLLGYFKEFQPDIYKGLMIIEKSFGTKLESTEVYRQFHQFEKKTIDSGILEKIPKGELVTVEADMGWEDVGISWESYYQALKSPKNENVETGEADIEYLESQDNLVIGPKDKMIGIIGLSEIAVIDTPDGLLVCKLRDSQKVKLLYEKLAQHHKKYIE